MVQEYGRYFGIPTCCLRGGCLTGPNHTGVELHGFLSYLVKCNLEGREYKVFGYKGKQVRDNIHSRDLIGAFDCFFRGKCRESGICSCDFFFEGEYCQDKKQSPRKLGKLWKQIKHFNGV